MTFDNLRSGSRVWRRVGVAKFSARWIVLIVAFGVLRADAAFAQRSLTSVLLPTDTTGNRKVSAPKVTTPKSSPSSNAFAYNQLANDRVLAARVEKRFELKQMFRDKGLVYPAAEIFMRVFKREHTLEMWVRPNNQDTFVLLKSYDICALSDKPGPKRSRGDLQTPEGFYYIDNFNPQSGYHLSLRVNYPNESDRILGADNTLGGDIFVHGGCKTAGCIAVTNENIKEIYWLAVEARDHGQLQIPVHIFPARLTNEAVQNLARFFNTKPDLVRFWSNIKPGFDYFEQNHKLPEYSINARGRYQYGHDGDNTGLLGKAVPVQGGAQQ